MLSHPLTWSLQTWTGSKVKFKIQEIEDDVLGIFFFIIHLEMRERHTKSINVGKFCSLTVRFSRLGICLYYNIILIRLLFSGIKINNEIFSKYTITVNKL